MIDNGSDIASLRNKHRYARSILPTDKLSASAEALVKQLASINDFIECNHVASYIAIRGEIDTLPVMQHFSGKHFYLPILRGKNMFFAPWQPGATLIKKGFGLLEPNCCDDDWIHPSALDVVLVPLVVFDQQCNRIGQGGGFYDRTFEFLQHRVDVRKPMLIGVAHESQCEVALRTQSWDVPLDLVVTESSVYRRSVLG